MAFLIGILEQGLIFSVAALGVYITYSILDFPDLSVDGTFALGAAASIISIVNSINPFGSLLIAFGAGALGGLVTGILHVNFKITNLLSGILVMIALYSVNLRVMGKANLPMFNKDSIFSLGINPLIIIGLIVLILKVLMDLLFKTKFGFILKASGDNEALVTALGVNIGSIKTIALMLSNGLVALSGGIMAQYQAFADISMGNGIMIVCLAAIILGQSIFKKERLLKATTVVVIGSVLYKLSIGLALRLGFPPTDVKLITSLIVVIAIVMNNKSVAIGLKSILGKRGRINA